MNEIEEREIRMVIFPGHVYCILEISSCLSEVDADNAATPKYTLQGCNPDRIVCARAGLKERKSKEETVFVYYPRIKSA